MFHLNIYLHKIKKRMNAKLARKTIVINLINQKYSETRTSWHLQRNKKRPSVGFETTLVHQGGLSVGQLQLSLNTDQWAETFFHKSLSSMKHLPTTCHTCTRPELVGYTHSCRRGLCRVLHMKADGSSDGSSIRAGTGGRVWWVILGFSVACYLGMNVVSVTLFLCFCVVSGRSPTGTREKERHFE